jgi:GT2 family glycosyltransferase
MVAVAGSRVSAVTAIVTAYQRLERTLETLRTIQSCVPAPAEILVHVDGNQAATAETIRRSHPAVRVLLSETSVGPGGGRNLMIAAAASPLVASFDDDSFPIDGDYFARVAEVFTRLPDASVVGAHVYHRHETVQPDVKTAAWVADFSGGACAYRRDHFLATGGYVPLETAYGMEEVDLALRLHALGRRVVQTPWLRVFHDTDLARHADPEVTAASIANIALLTYLRYPLTMWIVGAGQGVNRIWWLLGHGRHRGVWRGLASIPAVLGRQRRARRLVPAASVRSYLRLRRNPVPAGLTP